MFFFEGWRPKDKYIATLSKEISIFLAVNFSKFWSSNLVLDPDPHPDPDWIKCWIQFGSASKHCLLHVQIQKQKYKKAKRAVHFFEPCSSTGADIEEFINGSNVRIVLSTLMRTGGTVTGSDFPNWCGSMWIWIRIGVKSQIRSVSASKSKSGSGNVSKSKLGINLKIQPFQDVFGRILYRNIKPKRINLLDNEQQHWTNMWVQFHTIWPYRTSPYLY